MAALAAAGMIFQVGSWQDKANHSDRWQAGKAAGMIFQVSSE